MTNLILKVERCEKANSNYTFTCKDKYNIEYLFNSKCFKKVNSYILVIFNGYDITAGSLELAE